MGQIAREFIQCGIIVKGGAGAMRWKSLRMAIITVVDGT